MILPAIEKRTDYFIHVFSISIGLCIESKSEIAGKKQEKNFFHDFSFKF